MGWHNPSKIEKILCKHYTFGILGYIWCKKLKFHKWSGHTLGKHCIICKLGWRDYLENNLCRCKKPLFEISTGHCAICGKKPIKGNSIARRGLAKSKGGVGKKTTGITRRRFLPNLQKIRADLNGSIKTIKVCTSCIQAGKVKKVV